VILNFIKIQNKIYNIDSIESINAANMDKLWLTVYFKDSTYIHVSGLEAIEVIMATKPSFFEGQRLKFPKRKWILHNLVAHPLMQILALLGFRKQGLWLHEVTVPKPLGLKDA
jgi:hypothetical protein